MNQWIVATGDSVYARKKHMRRRGVLLICYDQLNEVCFWRICPLGVLHKKVESRIIIVDWLALNFIDS